MKIRNILILYFLIFGISLSGQKSYDLYPPSDTESKTYTARDYIWLHNGYSFSSAGGKTLHLTINEHLLEPAEYLQTSYQLPNPNRSINTSYAVGTMAGEASVSPSGAAIYQIPIEVMPGTGGLQPNISIVYNNQSGNGLVGYGWNLNAISAITRTGSTLYHDYSVAVPLLTNSDNLIFGGQRLMLESGSNLTTSSTYKTEIESYLEITCKTLNSYLGFEVKDKEGRTLEYGSSADTYIKPAGSSVAYAWLLKKVTDANGNYMTYTYDYNSGTGEFRLKQIDYTGNVSSAPYNKIEFFYETRTDSSTSYIAGKSVEQSVILKRIKCSAYGSTIRDYRCYYYYDGFYSKLTEVEEYGQNGLRYNSTIVDWGGYSIGKQNNIMPGYNRSGLRPIFADFDGDGKMDFITYQEKFTYTSSDLVTLYLSTSSPNGVTFVQKHAISLISDFAGLLVADLNGDGKMDIVRISLISSGTDKGKYKYEYFLFDGNQFTNSNINFIAAGKTGIVGDFNGDGKMEVLIKETQKLYNQNGVGTDVGGVSGIDWGSELVDWFPNNRYLSDFTGNGKTNLLIMNASGSWVYELVGNTFTKITPFSNSELKNSKFPLLGDFNGDGKTDVLIQKADCSIESILFSTGTEFKKQPISGLNFKYRVDVGDFNGDGKSDIIQLEENGNDIIIKIGLSNGTGFTMQPPVSSTLIDYTADLLNKGFMVDGTSFPHIFNDFTGDGRTDYCFFGYTDRYFMHTFTDSQKLSVKTIVNGLNQKTTFEYKPITDNACYTETTTPYTFPVSKFQAPLYVVRSMNRQAGNVSESDTIHYKGARIHRQGKGFLGFEEIKVKNEQQNRETITRYKYKYDSGSHYYTYPVKQTVTTVQGDSISRTDFENDRLIFFTPSTTISTVIFPYVKSQTTVDKLTGITKKIESAYTSSDHGNPNKVTETQGSLITETNYTWEQKGSSPFKNRVTQQVTTRKGIGTTFSETKKFAYDAKARLTQKIDFYGHSKAVTTVFGSYDNFGNPLTETTTAANCPTISVNSVYDATGRFVTSRTDALGNVSSARYDAATGVLLEKTDIAGLKTSYQYDGFQRRIQEVSPVDNLTYSIAWDISGNNLFKKTAQSSVAGAQTIWYNARGHETKKQMPGFSGTVISEKEYNSLGQLYRSYLPGYGSKSSQYIQYSYDNYGRLQSENNLGRTTTYGYSGLMTVITTPNNINRFSTLNSSGLLDNVKDESYSTVSLSYTYNSLGKPATTTSNGITTHITYDDRGFQQTLKDANTTNPVQYVYDAYGQLTSQTNARGQTTSFLYDAAGRITQQSCPERTLTYQYVTSGNGIGQIQTIKQNNNIVRSYGYTSKGQLSSVTEKIDNTDYTTSYIYDIHGRIIEKQSPSGMRISYQYNNNGLLTSMRNAENNNLLWQLDAANALGQITESTMGNGLKRVSGYDTYHLPDYTQLKNGGSDIDNVDYNFNAVTGNLTSRNDVSNSKNETFGYDNLNRLTSITPSGSVATGISYYPNGNINTKFDVGTYQYANGNHAVSDITNPVSSYNPSALDITNTSYNRVSSLTQQGSTTKKLDFQYNPSNQRNKSLYYENNVLKKTMYYVGNYEKEIISGGSTKEYDYIYTPEGLTAIAVKTNGVRSFYYTQTDHLGSIRVVTTESKGIQTRYYYDAWGKQTVTAGTSITNRGYIGQEHLNEFGLINLNARLYDPVLGRFMGMDPYVQMPDYAQSFNRYAYCLNNPLLYTDPTGEKWWHWLLGDILTGGAISSTVIITGVSVYSAMFPFTNECYEMQKYISPIAFKPNITFGSMQNGIGFDVSIGMLKGAHGLRYHYGATYYWSSYGGYNGWETRSGAELEILPFLSYSGTTFRAGEFTQTTNLITLGDPFNNIKYENDMVPEGIFAKIPIVPKGDGDRFRTAAVQLNSGPLSINLNIFTGDAGEGNWEYINGHKTYVENNGYNPNKYRAGALSFGFGPLRLGRNSEEIRKVFQNQFAHTYLTGGKSLWFEVLSIPASWYWSFGFGTGGTLW